jgi:replicative DNA helicase
MEMGEIDLWMRAACPPADVLYRDVISRRLSVDQMRNLRESSELLKELYGQYLVIDDRPQSTESIWQYAMAHRPDLIIVDHLRLLRDRGFKGELEAKRQGRIAENLKEISKSCNAAVVCLAQLNRGVEGRSDKRPGLADLRDSGEIEENADVIAFIHSPDYYDTTSGYKPTRNIELWIEKNRNGGRLIQVNLIYNLKQQTFIPARTNKVSL